MSNYHEGRLKVLNSGAGKLDGASSSSSREGGADMTSTSVVKLSKNLDM